MLSRYYLDTNATAPLHPAARAAIIDALDAANPMSPHAAGREAAMVVDRARSAVAALVGRPARTVFFTSGATEANAWALSGLRTAARPLVLASAVEHPSVLVWADHTIPVDEHGVVNIEALEELLEELGERLAVVSVMAANNETGVLQPMAAIAERVRRAGVLLHCDATQLPGRLRVDVPADLITVSAHKFGGPKGVGALIGDIEVAPLLRGGPQERGQRAGTHNVAGIAGMGAAAEQCGVMSPEGRDALEAMCVRLGGQVLGVGTARLPNTLSVLFPLPGDLVVMALDLAGVCASTGSACASGSSAPSHVLEAMGIRQTAVRLSLSPGQDVRPVLPILEQVITSMEAACEW
ncbi:MAG: cysteine desulfurase [Myxococcota bacterium]|jgi:cysteine desulfurase